jgi:hypothetical protein
MSSGTEGFGGGRAAEAEGVTLGAARWEGALADADSIGAATPASSAVDAGSASTSAGFGGGRAVMAEPAGSLRGAGGASRLPVQRIRTAVPATTAPAPMTQAQRGPLRAGETWAVRGLEAAAAGKP